MKELETITYRALQESFSQVMAETLIELDEAIALGRDKKRYYLKDKRTLKFESVFGQVELERNYYQDRESGKYVYLLDQYLAFDGAKGMSPVVQDLAMELAVTGVSYRQAGKAMEKLLGIHASLDGKTPHEVYQAQLDNMTFLENTAILDTIFLKREHRKVKADSTITLNRQLYEVPPRFIGQSIDVRFDEKGIFVFEDDQKIAEAVPVSMKDNAHVKRVRSPFTITEEMEGNDDV